MITKPKVIEAIQLINQSAKREWLDSFRTPALRRYLDRLELTQGPRGRDSIWTRRHETPAIVTKKPSL